MKKLLTEEKVKARATTPKKALDVSIQHHEENLELSETEMRERPSGGDDSPLAAKLCGLCALHSTSGCSSCILTKDLPNCHRTDSQYAKTLFALHAWENSTSSFADYRTEQFKMVELLKKLKQENYGDDKMKNETEIKLEQNKVDQQKLKDEQARLEAELEKAKPEIKFGDELLCVKGDRKGDVYYALYTPDIGSSCADRKLIAVNDDGCACGVLKSYREGDCEPTGRNLFRDLKRNAEDLDEFKVETVEGYFEAKIVFGNQIQITSFPHTSPIVFATFEEIHQKLGRMRATIKRRRK